MHPGFDTQNILLFGINTHLAGYKDSQAAQLYRQLHQRFAALPGVLSVSYSESALLSQNWSGEDVHLGGAPPKSNINNATLAVGPDFFSAMRIPILAGHAFTPSDFDLAEATKAVITAAMEAANKKAADSGSSSPFSVGQTPKRQSSQQPAPVPVLVNLTFARKFFPDQNPVSKHIGDSQEDEPATSPKPGCLILGVVADTKYDELGLDIVPTMFVPLLGRRAHFELRTAGDPIALVKQVRATVSQADNNLPLFAVRAQTMQIEETLFQERLISRLSSFFAVLALVLACIGLYGLLSYEVVRRTRELGIRMALGAQRRRLMRLVVQRGLLLARAGTVIGIGSAMTVTRLMAAMLYSVRPCDPVTFAGVGTLVVLVVLAACLIPARRAMRIDPMVALRDE